MKQKILFGVMAVIIFGSLFVSLKLATALNAEAMWLDPEFKTVTPTSDQLTFLYDLRINTTYTIQAWQAKLLYDPAVLRAIDVVWGTYFAPPENVSNAMFIPGTGESITLGQTFTWSGNSATGEGLLAQVNFTFVLPGATEIQFLEASVLDSNNDEFDLLGGSIGGKVKTEKPHAEFYWYTADGVNPLPNHTFWEGGDAMWHHDVVYFNASASFDVSNLVWDGDSFEPDAYFPNITEYFWDFGDGTNATGLTTSHIYQDYNQAGYLVNLTVTDGEGDKWSSTWRYGGPKTDDTVPMWRDVCIVDIWPSLDWIDNVHHVIGRSDNATYWAATALTIMPTAVNLGSVPEYCKVSLYAIFWEADLSFVAGPVYTPELDTEVFNLYTWWLTIGGQAGSGFDLWAESGWNMAWPPRTDNGFYTLFATIEFEGATSHDGDQSNNYFYDPLPLNTIWSPFGDNTEDFAGYACDINGDGSVGPADFAIFALNYGKHPPS